MVKYCGTHLLKLRIGFTKNVQNRIQLTGQVRRKNNITEEKITSLICIKKKLQKGHRQKRLSMKNKIICITIFEKMGRIRKCTKIYIYINFNKTKMKNESTNKNIQQ